MTVLRVSDIDSSMEGGTVDLDVMIKGAEKKTASNNSEFLNLTLADKDDEMPAKLWSVKPNQEAFFKEHSYARVRAKVGSYRNKLQLTVTSMMEIPEDEFVEKLLKQGAPESEEELTLELEATIESLEDEAIKEIVKRIYDRSKDKFVIWPAATRNHHNYSGGLLYHTVSMLRLGKNLLRQYPEGKLDADIVLGAVILHDIEKTVELTDAHKPTYADLKDLMGHIFMAGAEVYSEAKVLKAENPDLNTKKVKYLVHAILAHHGKLEWGSPVTPSTIEAEMVHQIDMMDSRMNMKY